MFYLPFQHGNQALKVLNDFYWLKNNANILVSRNKNDANVKIEIQEWIQRSQTFDEYCHSVYILSKKISTCANKELCYDLFSYIWDIATALSVLNAFVKWLALGCFPENINSYTQGSFTCKIIYYQLYNIRRSLKKFCLAETRRKNFVVCLFIVFYLGRTGRPLYEAALKKKYFYTEDLIFNFIDFRV